MKKITFAFVLALFANNAFADWVLIDSSSLGNLYFNNTKTKTKDNIVRAWTLISFSNMQLTENKRALKLSKQRETQAITVEKIKNRAVKVQKSNIVRKVKKVSQTTLKKKKRIELLKRAKAVVYARDKNICQHC